MEGNGNIRHTVYMHGIITVKSSHIINVC
jgi:hypothetical protein